MPITEPKTPPEGYEIVKTGQIMLDDLFWGKNTGKWLRCATVNSDQRHSLGKSVEHAETLIARPIPGIAKTVDEPEAVHESKTREGPMKVPEHLPPKGYELIVDGTYEYGDLFYISGNSEPRAWRETQARIGKPVSNYEYPAARKTVHRGEAWGSW